MKAIEEERWLNRIYILEGQYDPAGELSLFSLKGDLLVLNLIDSMFICRVKAETLEASVGAIHRDRGFEVAKEVVVEWFEV